jgi:hypothetical protein
MEPCANKKQRSSSYSPFPKVRDAARKTQSLFHYRPGRLALPAATVHTDVWDVGVFIVKKPSVNLRFWKKEIKEMARWAI